MTATDHHLFKPLTLNQHGIVCSMSRKGNCWDNTVMERVFHSLKSEQVHFMCFKPPLKNKKEIGGFNVEPDH